MKEWRNDWMRVGEITLASVDQGRPQGDVDAFSSLWPVKLLIACQRGMVLVGQKDNNLLWYWNVLKRKKYLIRSREKRLASFSFQRLNNFIQWPCSSASPQNNLETQGPCFHYRKPESRVSFLFKLPAPRNCHSLILCYILWTNI